jgi:hypothetical protein
VNSTAKKTRETEGGRRSRRQSAAAVDQSSQAPWLRALPLPGLSDDDGIGLPPQNLLQSTPERQPILVLESVVMDREVAA